MEGFHAEKSMKKNYHFLCFILLAVFFASQAKGELFNLTHFIQPKKFALGFEPKVVINKERKSELDYGIDLRATYGLTELNNLIVTFGTTSSGSQTEPWHCNTTLTFDLFADHPDQSGVGVGIAFGIGTYSKFKTSLWQAMPTFYLHKTFLVRSESGVIFGLEPFIGVPFRFNLSLDRPGKLTNSLSLGSFFHLNQKLSSIFEIALGVSNANNSAAGGLAYYF
jgi:hypothetical protein